MEKVRREFYLKSLIDSMGNSMIKVITGIRRCGKSYLLNELFYGYLLENNIKAEQIIRVNLEEKNSKRFLQPGVLEDFIKDKLDAKKMSYIFIDEVQKLPDFEAVLSELNNLPHTDIFVTGSNSQFLSSDIITEFRGRGDEVRVHPFSFAEFCQAKKAVAGAGAPSVPFALDESRLGEGRLTSDAAILWREYINFGGMPLSLSFGSEERKSAYLKGLFQEVYFSDIEERYGLKNNTELASVVDALASSVGSLTNPHRLASYFESAGIKNITENEIKKYIFYLSDAFLINRANRYDIKGNKYLATPSKYYYEDVGLRNARLNFRQQEMGHLMENVLYNELVMRGFNVDVGVVEVNVTEGNKNMRKQYEVDFVCNQIDKRYYIQSAYAIPDEAKMRQETESLSRITDAFKKVVVVRDSIRPYRNEKGILFVGLIDFLLKPEILREA